MNHINPKVRALGVLVLGSLLVFAFLSRLDIRRGPIPANADDHQVTVERLPSSEAKVLGVDPRNH